MASLKRKGDLVELRSQLISSIVVAKSRSHSLTNGKVRQIKHYTAKTIDWIAVYDRTSDRCYYCPATELGNGRSLMSLRLTPALNGQRIGIRPASDYLDPDFDRVTRMEPAGFEPATS